MKWLSVVAVIAFSACGGTTPITAPTPAPTPVANVIAVSAGWANCLPAIGSFPGSCQLQGSVQNTGTGCAATVRGTIVFKNGTAVIGTTAAWGLGAAVLRPNETLVYLSTTETLDVVNRTTGYVNTPAWTNVACQ